MRLQEFTEEPIQEARMVWRRMGNKVKRAIRCTSGRRKGRVVSNASQCNAPIDMKKRLMLKRTKRMNPASRRLRTLNKRRR